MKFWAIDSPVMRVLGRLGDIIILNMIFVVGCIPVITIGTSLSALYAVAMKMARGEDPSVWKEFWKAYKRNFRPATICWLVMAVIAVLLFVDFRIIGVLLRLCGAHFYSHILQDLKMESLQHCAMHCFLRQRIFHLRS